MKKQNSRTLDEIAGLSGVPKGTINKIFAGQTKDPQLSSIKAIVNSLGYTLDDLLENNPSPQPQHTPLETEHLKKYRALDGHGKEAVDSILNIEYQRIACTLKPEKPEAKLLRLDFSEQPCSAGRGTYLGPDAFSEIRVEENALTRRASFAVPVSGDSMEPKIHDGAIVFVQACLSIDPGQIGIFVLNGQAYCKKLAVDHAARQIRLVSLHPGYPDIVVGGYDSFRTVGRVLGQWLRSC